MLCGRAIAFLLLGVAATAAVAADRREMMEKQKQQALDAILKKPKLDAGRIEDIFSIRREGTDLALHAYLTPTKYYEERYARLEGIGFPAQVQCRALPSESVDFRLTLDDWSNILSPGHLDVVGTANTIQFDKKIDNADGELAILFAQNGINVELKVTSTDINSRSAMLSFQADNFLQLRIQHPMEVETYLRPIFRELRQEAALAPDSREAWQVLADDWPVDPSYKDKVEKYLAALDDGDFRVRSAAGDQLFRLGRGAATYLLHMDRSGLSAEQVLRLDEIIARYRPLPELRANKLHDDLHFLCDCLDCDDPIVRKLALARLKKLGGKDFDFDLKATGKERITGANGVRDQLFNHDGTAKKKM